MTTDRKTPDASPLSIVICAFNGLEYTKLLLDSIRRHSKYAHEVIIYSDGSTDGTFEWLRDQADVRWQHDRQNRGICTAMNRAAAMASREYLFFPNTDHVLAPGWDEALLKRVAPRTVVSCQCIEPGIVPVASIFHARNCGGRWDQFDEGKFHAAVREVSRPREVPGVNYPFTLSKGLWDELGGLDVLFDPGPANDPDLFYRLTFVGARMVRAEDVLVYHFSGKSSRLAGEAATEHSHWHEVTERNERRFEEKWGERYHYVNGGLPKPGPGAADRWRKMRGEAPRVEVPSAPCRVVIDARGVGPRAGGIGLYTTNLIRSLGRLNDGPEVQVLGSDLTALRAALGEAEGVRLLESGVAQGDLRRESTELVAEVRSSGAQIFHGPAFSIPPGIPVPAVVTIHDLAFVEHPEWYPRHFVDHLTRICGESTRAAAAVIVNSDFTKGQVLGKFPSSGGKLHRIYEALPEECRSGGEDESGRKEAEGLAEGKPYILSVGVQQRRKNAAGLVRAFARVRETSESSLALVLVGGLECEDPELVPLIRSLGLEKDVVLTKHLRRGVLASLYHGAKLFAYPSLQEGFGFPPLEAMASGVPVVCSDRGSLPEIVGPAAKQADPENPEALAGAMSEVLRDQNLRDFLVLKGRERVEAFSWERAARETADLYARCLEMSAPIRVDAPSAMPEAPARPVASPRGSVRRHGRKRVAVDARLYGSGRLGTGRYTREILRALFARDRGAEFVLIGNDFAGLEDAPVVQEVQAGPETLLDAAWEQFALPTHLLGCDAYFAPTGIIPVARPCPAVAVIHDVGFLDEPGYYEAGLRNYLGKWVGNACRSAERLVTVSEFTKGRVLHHYKLPGERLRVVRHGSPPESRPGGSKRHLREQPAKEDYILCVSSFEPNKNLPALMSAFEIISRSWPGQLVLAGREGRDLSSLRKQAEDSKLSDRLSFVVDPEDEVLTALYRNATVFAFPSLYEGFGLPLLEAMAAGVPVVTSRVSACAEVAGDAAFLVDAPTANQLSAGLSRVLGDSGLLRGLSRKGSERAATFRWSRAADDVWEVISECMEGA